MPAPQNIGRDDSITAIRFPIRLLTLVCLLTIVAFAWFGWILFDLGRDAKIFLDKGSRIEELRGVIVHLDEVLTMSARMAAATGDSRWEERYRQFEPQLDAAIKETTKIGTGPSDVKATTKMDEANIKLVEMENRAFALVRGGRKEEAQAVLFSPEHETQKKIYIEGTASFVDQVRRKLDESLEKEERVDLLSIVAALVVGGTSFVAWWSAARGVRRWRAQLLDNVHRRAEAEENLRKAHAELEVRVKERTAELANANEALQGENTERKRTEEALRASEAHLQTVVENLDEGVVVCDLNGKLLHWNRAALEIHGVANVDDGARKLTELVDTFELSAMDGTPIPVEEWPLSRILRGESLHDLELRVRNIKTGLQRIFNYGGTLVHDANNQPLLGVVTISDITERKQAEDLIRASEERYRALFESNPSPMWVYDLETLSFLAVNAAAVKHYGYSQGEFRAMTIKDIRPSEDIPALMDDLSQKNDDLDYSKQWRHCTKDGRLIEVEITSHELTWLGRRAKVALINDVTERKRAEETLREQAALFDQTYDAVLVWDWKGAITFWNRGAENLYGYTDGEAVGRTSQQLLNTQVTGGLQTLIESLDRDGVWQGELEHTTSDGRQITVESRMALVREPKREYVLEINRDITERKRGEERLIEQADIINRAHDAIIIRNFEDRRVVFWNNGAERLYGWTAAEVMGEAGEANFDDPEEIEKIMSALLSADEFRGEVKQITKEGKELITEGRATLVRNPDGTPRSVLIICTDVTKQKNLETHLLRAQRLESIGTLASGVAHDLNNILTPILICAEILRENPTGEDAASSIALIEESAKRGANVVKQVLTFARGIEGESVPIKPSHLIQEMVDIAQNTFPKRIEILGRYTDDLWSIKCDPTQLHQVLLNLSVNARDAMPNGGSITIGAENFDVDEHYASMTPGAKPGPHVMFRVSDTGAGMSHATIDKIFDPFFTTKEIGKGTGLGLSTALGIIKSHGGFISVYSEIGTGTTFKIFLPAQVSEAPSPKSAASLESLNGNGELILVVDDEAGILRVTKMILEKHNYRVLEANDGTEALAAFAQQMGSINAVLTDIMMPYVDGVALIRAIKKMKPEMVFIASTGQGEATRVAELESLGVSKFLTKPYDTARLLKTLRDTLSV